MNAIEAPRLSAEELAGLGATVHEFAWHQDSTDDLITTLGGALHPDPMQALALNPSRGR